jgi:hypothetical protein
LQDGCEYSFCVVVGTALCHVIGVISYYTMPSCAVSHTVYDVSPISSENASFAGFKNLPAQCFSATNKEHVLWLDAICTRHHVNLLQVVACIK